MAKSPASYDPQKELDELEPQVQGLKARAEALEAEAKLWCDKRDALNAGRKRILQEIKEIKTQRDKINDVIKKLKEERTSVHVQAAPKRERIEAYEKRIVELSERTTRSESEILRLIQRLDWEIQTNPLTASEEKALVSKVKELEGQALVHKGVRTLKDKKLELQAELKAYRITANNVHENVLKLAQQSQEYHERLLSMIEEAQNVKAQADEAHKKFTEVAKLTDEAYNRYVEVAARVKALRFEIRQIQENETRRRIEALMAAQSEAAIKKLMGKKKLSFNEFKILKEKGLI